MTDKQHKQAHLSEKVPWLLLHYANFLIEIKTHNQVS